MSAVRRRAIALVMAPAIVALLLAVVFSSIQSGRQSAQTSSHRHEPTSESAFAWLVPARARRRGDSSGYQQARVCSLFLRFCTGWPGTRGPSRPR